MNSDSQILYMVVMGEKIHFGEPDLSSESVPVSGSTDPTGSAESSPA